MVNPASGFGKRVRTVFLNLPREDGMHSGQRKIMRFYAALCLSACLLFAACGSPKPAQTGDQQADLLYRLIQEREDQQMRLARIEQRIAGLEQGQGDLKAAYGSSPPQAASPSMPPHAVVASPAPAPAPRVPPVVSSRVSVEPFGDVPAQPAPPRARQATRAVSVPPEYQRALSLLLDQGKPEDSRTAFSIFLTDNPNHPLAPNVLYWVGETYYAEKKYDDAILMFKDVAARFQKHDKAPDALYKAVLSYRHLGDRENAAYLQKLLLDDYPKSRAAGLLQQGGR